MQLGVPLRLLAPSTHTGLGATPSGPISSRSAALLTLFMGRTWKRTYAPSGVEPTPGVKSERPRLSELSATSLTTLRSARSSDWPCLMLPGQCWEAEFQFALLSMKMRMFGFCALLPVLVNRSMSSAATGAHRHAIAAARVKEWRKKNVRFTKPPVKRGIRAVGYHVQSSHQYREAQWRCHVHSPSL